jgi:hypothetical protein
LDNQQLILNNSSLIGLVEEDPSDADDGDASRQSDDVPPTGFYQVSNNTMKVLKGEKSFAFFLLEGKLCKWK